MNLYDRIAEWLTAHPISTGGALALVLTALRVLMAEDRKPFGMVCVEGLACGLLSMAFSSAATGMLGVDNSVGVLIGASAGFIGLDRMKALFIRVIDAYISRHSDGTETGKGE